MTLTLAMAGLFHQTKDEDKKKEGDFIQLIFKLLESKIILTLLGRPHLVVDLICFGKNITQLKKHLTSEFGGYQPSVGQDSSQTRLKENSGLVVCPLWKGMTPRTLLLYTNSWNCKSFRSLAVLFCSKSIFSYNYLYASLNCGNKSFKFQVNVEWLKRTRLQAS